MNDNFYYWLLLAFFIFIGISQSKWRVEHRQGFFSFLSRFRGKKKTNKKRGKHDGKQNENNRDYD